MIIILYLHEYYFTLFLVIAGIFIFIGGTTFGSSLTAVGFFIYFLKKKKRNELNAQGSKVQPSPGVLYEEINSAVSTSSKPIELQDNAAYGRMQSHQ